MVFFHALQGILSLQIIVTVAYVLARKGWFSPEIQILLPRLVTTVALPSYLFYIAVSYNAKVTMAIIAISLAYVTKQTFAPQWFELRNQYIDPGKRASFSSTLVLVSLVFGSIIFA